MTFVEDDDFPPRREVIRNAGFGPDYPFRREEKPERSSDPIMEDIIHRFAKECALISTSSGGEASTAAATSSVGNPAMREDMSHQREDTPGFNSEPAPVSARTEQDLLKRAHKNGGKR